MPREVRPARAIAALQRRADYLGELIAAGEANTFDRAEYQALRWALPQLEELNPQPQGRKKP